MLTAYDELFGAVTNVITMGGLAILAGAVTGVALGYIWFRLGRTSGN